MATSTSSEKKHVPTVNTQPEPPEEQFWQRYSPHHEFPLSTVGTVLVYLSAAVVVWAAVTLTRIFTASVPLEVAAVEVAQAGTGTDSLPPGRVGAPGDPGPKEGVDEPATDDERKQLDVPSLNELPAVAVAKTELSEDVVVSDDMLNNASQSLQDLRGLSKEQQTALTKGLRGPKKSGAGGENGESGGGGLGDKRVQRMARWALVFNTHGGEDYANQLAALGAIVGVPTTDPNQFLVVRDLKNPRPQLEDVTKITLMRWADTRPDSVAGLAQALRLPGTPQAIWAFFPESVEQQMKKAEHDYRGLNENQILETRFQVALRGNRYVPVVRDQRPAPR